MRRLSSPQRAASGNSPSSASAHASQLMAKADTQRRHDLEMRVPDHTGQADGPLVELSRLVVVTFHAPDVTQGGQHPAEPAGIRDAVSQRVRRVEVLAGPGGLAQAEEGARPGQT